MAWRAPAAMVMADVRTKTTPIAPCQLRPSGVPRVSDEELATVLRSSRAYLITAIGVIGMLAILYLMIFKPKL